MSAQGTDPSDLDAERTDREVRVVETVLKAKVHVGQRPTFARGRRGPDLGMIRRTGLPR